MTTPSSSTTSPSPPMAYLAPTAQPLQQSSSASSASSDKEQRKKAVQKFLARAEISMVTRALRARLSYASYKATHNVPHLSLFDLESRVITHPHPIPPSTQHRAITTKRKVATTARDGSNATTGHAITGGTHRRGGSDSMAPPASLSRNNHHSTSNGITTTAHFQSDPSFRTATSLYSSILAPPPNKQVRTIHNTRDPPITAPSRTAPVNSPRTRTAKPNSRAEGRGRGRAKAADRSPKTVETPTRRRKTSSIDKGKQKQALTDAEVNVDADGDVAMKAAQTLTSWRLHNRQPSNVAGSPRSSFDGSDTNSTYSHFAQSSARTTTTVGSVASATSPTAASIASTVELPARSRTPSPASKIQEHATPRAAPTDDEAADLMLLFATSPSPARPSTVSKDARDMAAFRALSGGNNALLSKGRVLFPSSGEMHGAEEATSPGGGRQQLQYRHQHTKSGPPLTRGSEVGSFSSSISSISSELGRRGSMDATSGLPSRMGHLGPSQLLPPPPLPIAPAGGTTTPEHAKGRGGSAVQSPKSSGGQTAEFNLSDFINASPSPLRPGAGQGQCLSLGQGAQKPSLGLRADVGRKLFEEEQIKNVAAGPMQNVTKSPHARELGAGIDLDAMRSGPYLGHAIPSKKE